MPRNLLHAGKGFCEHRIAGIQYIPAMRLWNYERVPVGIFRHVQKSVYIVIFVDFVGRNFSRNNFAK
jgi:hypothetical protein